MNAADKLESLAKGYATGSPETMLLLRNAAALVRACEDDKIALYRYDRDDVLTALAKLNLGVKGE